MTASSWRGPDYPERSDYSARRSAASTPRRDGARVFHGGTALRDGRSSRTAGRILVESPRRRRPSRPRARARYAASTKIAFDGTPVPDATSAAAARMAEPNVVGILVGSESDRARMQAALDELDARGIAWEFEVRSAHRTPDAVAEYAARPPGAASSVLICGAGLAAALPGVVAAHTELPVIGVPLRSSMCVLDGLDALLSIVQMPPGVPVATRRRRQREERRGLRGAHPGAGCTPSADGGDRSRLPRDRPLLPPRHGPDLVRGGQARALARGRARSARWLGRAGRDPGRGRRGDSAHAPSRRRRSASPRSSRRPTTTSRRSSTRSPSSSGGRPLVHYGLTSSDVVDTALALQIRDAGRADRRRARPRARPRWSRSPRSIAHTICIGRSHGIHAEPTTFGWKLAGWAFELDRDRDGRARPRGGPRRPALGHRRRLRRRRSGGRADRLRTARARAGAVSTQVIARDRHAELLAALALCATSLDRFATEIRHLARTEVREVEEPFATGMKGSSAMPHKRNPKVAERICGLARVVRGAALVGFENVPLWHERDISHSSAERVVIPDSFLALDYMLDRFAWIVEGLVVYPERMRAEPRRRRTVSFFSHRLLLALVEAGLERERRVPARAAQRDAGLGRGARLPRARRAPTPR